jgi:cytochrome c556
MKKIAVLFAMLTIACAAVAPASAEDGMAMDHHAMHHNHLMMDERISLNLSPEMKLQQLQNMRSHVAAVQSIVGHLANNEFDIAAEIAHSKLGLTEEMKKMCSHMSDNKDFTKLALEFHQSADQLGDVLQTKDMKKSLQALQTTMNYCVQCHATFRQ